MENYDAEYCAIQEEYHNKELLQSALQDEYFFESFEELSKEDGILSLITSENFENYRELVIFMENKPSLSLLVGINRGLPYYQTELHGRQVRIYITKELRRQIYNYLRNSVIPNELPDVDDVYKNMDENFILYSLKIDRKNNAMCYDETTKEHKAEYKNGTINYGQLPYTTEELKAKLDTLQ